jgi:hypothetical protein
LPAAELTDAAEPATAPISVSVPLAAEALEEDPLIAPSAEMLPLADETEIAEPDTAWMAVSAPAA